MMAWCRWRKAQNKKTKEVEEEVVKLHSHTHWLLNPKLQVVLVEGEEKEKEKEKEIFEWYKKKRN